MRVSHTFNPSRESFSVGIEEELLLVEPDTHRLSHSSSTLLARMGQDERAARHDIYEAQLELSSPPCASAGEAVAALERLRAAAREAGAATIGAGLHPAGEFGDVELVDAPRYAREAEYLQGVLARTPDCALHVHVGVADPETALRVCNGLREWLPMLEALAANSPFWHGRDSGLASARRVLRRGFPRVGLPPRFHDWAGYERAVEAVTAAGELQDYTFIWWEVRPHPLLGTVEVRAMDSQASLGYVAGLAALVQGLAKHLAQDGRRAAMEPDAPAWAALEESSFRAGRFGLDASVLHDGAQRPVRERVREAVALARGQLRELGAEAPLEEVERMLVEGNGADRQRAAHRSGGMEEVLASLAAETAAPLR